MSKLTTAWVLIAAVVLPFAAAADEYTMSPQLAQVGVNQSIQAAGKYGKGITIGIVDTGIYATHNELKGRVSAKSACAAVTFACSSKANDDHGHGTHVAGIAAGGLNGNAMVGVAPQATIVGMKVLNANGSGFDVDVANGIRKAADQKAAVINLSLTYIPTASVVSAINYAASKGSNIVFAGGNSAMDLLNNANSYGLTAAAVNRLIFVGSVDANNVVSDFSNTPGSGSAVTTTNAGTAYKSLWLMAPGEDILSSYIGSPYMYAWASGTSMAAPVVSGAIALLDARWPILQKNGTTSQVLFATATDLGDVGVDAVYGNGLLNINRAFQPLGPLSVKTAKGGSMLVDNVTNSTLTSGALGKLSKISKQLTKYTSFDSYQRDFIINLSGMIAARSSSSSLTQSVTGPQSNTGGAHFADGSSFSFGNFTSSSIRSVDRPADMEEDAGWFMSFTNAAGSTMAAGTGFPGSASFAEAMWGSSNPVAQEVYALGISNSLLSLAEGGTFAAFGTRLDANTRMAFSWSQTTNDTPLGGTNVTAVDANGFGIGVAHRMNESWTAGFTFNLLNEQNGLLGSTYNGSLLQFGDRHSSMSVGISSAFDLGHKRNLLVDAALSRSDGASVQDGLISSVSPLLAYSFGTAFVQQDAVDEGDRLSLSLRAPLRVFSGSAALVTTSVNEEGDPLTSHQMVSLRPDGQEVNLGLSYQAPIREDMDWSLSLNQRFNADNVQGEHETSIMFDTRLSF